MYEDYECEYSSLQSFLEIPSILDNFSIDTASVIAQQIILSIKGESCSCSLNVAVYSKPPNIHGKEVEKEREKKDHLNYVQSSTFVSKPQTVSLKTSKDVNWALEVMKYAINMPLFSNLDVVKHTVHIYCHWLSRSMCAGNQFFDSDSDSSIQSKCIPACIRLSVNEYATVFIASLCNFFKNFIQNYSSFYILGSVTTNDQANVIKEISNLIELILSTIENISVNSSLITNEIWDSLMYFGLNVGNLMLSSPSEPNQITYILGDRISCMVFRIWLQACSKCFPRPSMWKTFNKLTHMWRHQEAFINQWNKITAAFTNKLIKIMYNDNFPKLPQVDVLTNEMIPEDLNSQYIKDCWYRFLNLIGNPVDLCISKLILSNDCLDPKLKRRASSQVALTHAMNNLPNNFHRAMHGLSAIIDAFLGLPQPTSGFVIAPTSIYAPALNPSQLTKISSVSLEQASPPEVRKVPAPHQIFNIRRTKQGSTNVRSPTIPYGPGSNNTSEGILTIEAMSEPHILRPEVNSMLRLFGNWLFEAAVVGVKQNLDNAAISVRAGKIEANKFNAGRAEACASLCRIFTRCHRHNLSRDYLAKFYIVLFYSFDVEPQTGSSLVLSNVIFNMIDILKIGLIGVNVLIPRLFRGVEFVLGNDMEMPELISKTQLRRAAIYHLMAMVNLPTHFLGIDIKPLLPVANMEKKDTFVEIRRSMSLLISENIKYEVDPVNLSLLIACLMALLENLAKEVHLDARLKNIDSPSNEKIDLKGNNVVITVPSASSNSGSEVFNHSLGLLSINIVYRWRDDLNSLQFALETLSDMSKLKFKFVDKQICKRAVRFLCEFIENQMNRENKEHSRQLHNVIISAYYCLSLWLVHHPYLLDDKECLSSVLEISERGISGSKSKENGNDNIQIKNNKKASPTSKRVQVASEFLLQCIMTEVGAFPGPMGAETTSSLVKEEVLLRSASSTPGDENHCCFRYFGLDNDIILALLERPLDKSASMSDPLPTLSVIIRTTFGRYVWEMKLRQLPINNQNKEIESFNLGSPQTDFMNNYNATSNMLGKLFSNRPFNTGIYKKFNDIPISDGTDTDVEPRNFPEVLSKVESFHVEFSIPKLESLMDDSEKHRIESAIIDNLSVINSVRMNNIKLRQSRTKNELQYKKPIAVSEFQTARLLLYHLGYLSVNTLCSDGISDIATLNEDSESISNVNRNSDNADYGTLNVASKNNNNALLPTITPSVIYPLDSSTSNFFASLDSLDRTPSRSTDTCLIYYVKTGQSDLNEIIANYNDWPNFNTDFIAILLSLGWLIDANDHPGWTGSIETSFNVGMEFHNSGVLNSQHSLKHRLHGQSKLSTSVNTSSTNIPKEFQKLVQGPVPDGTSCLIYWADSLKEVAFLIASNDSLTSSTYKADITVNTSENAVTPTGPGPIYKDFSLTQPKQDKSKECGLAVCLVWIEEWDDLENINIPSLVGGEKLGIIVCPIPEGLFRINVHRPPGKHFGAGPLFSGMILDINNVGALIRQTVINVNRRMRQSFENFFASHFHRSQKLTQIISEHQLQLTTSQLPDLFTSLLHPPINRTEPRF